MATHLTRHTAQLVNTQEDVHATPYGEVTINLPARGERRAHVTVIVPDLKAIRVNPVGTHIVKVKSEAGAKIYHVAVSAGVAHSCTCPARGACKHHEAAEVAAQYKADRDYALDAWRQAIRVAKTFESGEAFKTRWAAALDAALGERAMAAKDVLAQVKREAAERSWQTQAA